MATDDFKYHSLDKTSDEIRLVTIKSGKATDPIQCTLSKHLLSELPHYEALSYAWGNAAETRPISLDGYGAQVTNNLHSALRHLRQESEDRVMWIDAVCINQENYQEKNHQVGMMKRIFETAEQVVVWLGEGFKDVGAVFEKLKVLRSFRAERVQSMTPEDIRELFGLEIWTAFQSLGAMAWWTRVWVIQEVEVARKILVVCGKSEISAEDFDASIADINRIRQLNLNDVWGDAWGGVRYPGHVREYQSRDLLYLAQKYRNRKSTDPRDKLYALIGITEEVDFEPDYTLSVLEVYQRFVAACIQRSGKVDVLNFVHSSTKLDLPSWIPDWSDAEIRRGRYLHSYESWDEDPFFNASGGTSAEFDTISSFVRRGETIPNAPGSPLICIVKGFTTDTVALQGDPLADLEAAATPNSALMQQWISMYRSQYTAGGPYKIQDLRIAFLLTLLGDWMPGRNRASNYPEICILSFLHWWSGERSGPSYRENVKFEFVSHFTLRSWGRRFIVSNKGYFGLVPSHSIPGDLICILFGGQTPFILRKVEDVPDSLKEGRRYLVGDGSVYRLIGDCYIHGIMDGEAYEEFKSGKSDVKEQKFVLM